MRVAAEWRPNALTLHGGLAWRDIALIRTLSRFLRQIRVPYSQDYMWSTLVKHAGIAANVVELFHARFDPRADKGREDKQSAIVARIEEELQKVESLDEDRILRRFVNAVQSAVRTNFFQTDKDGQLKPLISVKFQSRKLTDLPLPRPLYEIFVYSPRMEGVHMRFGKVARGGIRWSDRPQDFRTEVLGLVKAQQVKNAVIVPVGAKGGFVPKLMPKGAPRDAVQAEGVATYKLLFRRCSTSPTISGRTARSFRRRAWCAMKAMTPYPWSRPTRVPRPSPTSPMRFQLSTAIGLATLSHRVARPATTTRPWALPRAVPGKR